TYMLGIDASHLTGIPVGSIINGVSFRTNVSTSNPASWPAVDTTWTPYDVLIGPAIPINSWTTTFMSNFAATPTVARAGAMVITPGTYTTNTGLPAPQPNPWGEFFWDFQTPFTYTGGDLAIYFAHPGSDQANQVFFDTVASAPAAGYAAYSASAYQAATGASASFFITRIHYGYGAGCPGTGGLTPNLVQTNNTTGGGTVKFSIANAPANAPAAYAIGVGRTSVTLPNGCTLLTNPAVLLPVALDNHGRFLLSLNVPAGVIGTLNVQA